MRTPPFRDYRDKGLQAYCAENAGEAGALMDAVLAGLPLGIGRVATPFLPLADRISNRWLARAGDPYAAEIAANRDAVGRAGVPTFTLSYEWGCTSAVRQGDGAPRLMRVLDWPFDGIGERIELVHLASAAGEWAAATWPGVTGVLQATAPGRFAAAINQAPERRSRLGRPVAWLAGKARLLRQDGLAPAHLLRHVFETAPDYATARRRLSDEPICTPVIYTLTGAEPGEACVIERLETSAAVHAPDEAAPSSAANHFRHMSPQGRWRPRGLASDARARIADDLAALPGPDQIAPPILNARTRLAMTLSADGDVALCGYDGERRTTNVLRVNL